MGVGVSRSNALQPVSASSAVATPILRASDRSHANQRGSASESLNLSLPVIPNGAKVHVPARLNSGDGSEMFFKVAVEKGERLAPCATLAE